MSTHSQPPTRLASEDVIINAPMSYAGSAQRLMRMRRRAHGGAAISAITALAVLFVLMAWIFVTAWYLTWGLLLVPYRLLRRGSRKRRAEALRHRELLGTIQGSAAASAAAIVAASIPSVSPPAVYSPTERVADVDRERVMDELREHLLAGRLTPDEFEDRIGSAQSARTRADLDAAKIDLPMSPAA